eukprot:6204696-Pleurochrysis_carterae.AAC.4
MAQFSSACKQPLAQNAFHALLLKPFYSARKTGRTRSRRRCHKSNEAKTMVCRFACAVPISHVQITAWSLPEMFKISASLCLLVHTTFPHLFMARCHFIKFACLLVPHRDEVSKVGEYGRREARAEQQHGDVKEALDSRRWLLVFAKE